MFICWLAEVLSLVFIKIMCVQLEESFCMEQYEIVEGNNDKALLSIWSTFWPPKFIHVLDS